MQEHVLKVEQDNSDQRLDVFLTANLPDVSSRSFVKKLINDGHVIVNEKSAKAHYKVHPDDVIKVEIPDPVLNEIKPEDIPLEVIHQDDDIIVINKPCGLTVHPANGVYSGTLVNALLFKFSELSDVNTSQRPGIVHRLDRETSGVMVVAKNNKAHVRLARQFEKHRVRKKYVALVEGLVEHEEGIIDAPLAKHPSHYDKKTISYAESAKNAITKYQVLKRYQKATQVALFPSTGRTHQLRVHMQHIGHAILGDEKYGKKGSFPRLALHAENLGFEHPNGSGFVEFHVPIPEEFDSIT